LTALLGYFAGSIPTGFLLAKARGIDIRTVGSGNIGATNVSRSLGKGAGILVLVADGLKGWLSVVLIAALVAGWFGAGAGSEKHEWFRICAGVGAVLGHNFTCWLHFKGGKGIATSAGVLLALVPWTLLIIFGVWVVVFALTRYVSLASISASVACPFATWIAYNNSTLVLVMAAMAVLAVFQHRANVKRLLEGTESRFGAKQTPPSNTPSAP
jgi:glycerol-3-phosphate acyltransferase PlsY